MQTNARAAHFARLALPERSGNAGRDRSAVEAGRSRSSSIPRMRPTSAWSSTADRLDTVTAERALACPSPDRRRQPGKMALDGALD